jgi:hypothetical protein
MKIQRPVSMKCGIEQTNTAEISAQWLKWPENNGPAKTGRGHVRDETEQLAKAETA